MALLLIRHRTPFARLESEVQQLFKHIEKPCYVSKISQTAHRKLSAGSTALRRPGIVIRALQTSFLGCRSALSGHALLRSRNIQTHRKPAFEIDGLVQRDVLVYSYKNNRLYRFFTLGGLMQTALFGLTAYFMATSMKSSAAKLEDETSNPLLKGTMTFFGNHNGKFTITTIFFGLAMMALTLTFPLRSVTALTLLKGGKTVRVGTYSHFGTQRHFDTALETISCEHGRLGDGKGVAMKIKNHSLHYQLNKRGGIFHEKDLYDLVIGLKRKL